MSAWNFIELLIAAKKGIALQQELEESLAPPIASLEQTLADAPVDSQERMWLEATKIVYTNQVESAHHTFIKAIKLFFDLHDNLVFDLRELFNDQTLLYQLLTELPELNLYLYTRLNLVVIEHKLPLLICALQLKECKEKTKLLNRFFNNFRTADARIKNQYPDLAHIETLWSGPHELKIEQKIINVLKQMIPNHQLSWTTSDPIEITQIKNLIKDIHEYFNNGNLPCLSTSRESTIHIKEMLSDAITQLTSKEQKEKSLIIFQGCLHYLNEHLQSLEATARADNRAATALKK